MDDAVDEPTLNSVKGGMLFVRLLLLSAATKYGLASALGSRWPGAVEAWGAWMEELRAIIEQVELTDRQKGSDAKPMAPLVRVLQDSEVVSLFETLKRTGGLVGRGLLSGPGAQRAWLERLERLEATTRRLERFGMIPMGEASIEQPGVELLGALEDSLTLVAYGAREHRELRASSIEVYALLCAARDDLVWTRYERDPVALPIVEYDDGEEYDSSEPFERVRELREHVMELEFLSEAPAPDGRELDPRQREETRRRLVAGAVCLRRLAHFPADSTLPGSDVKLRHVMVALRSWQRSLVLAISDRQDRRALVATVEELDKTARAASRRAQ